MVGNKLKELRTKKGYTIAQLCKELGMNQNTYAKYERDERDVSTDTLSQLADFYDVTTDYLLGREDDLLDFLSLDDKILEEQLGKMLIKFYRNTPSSLRKELLGDAKRIFEMYKQEADRPEAVKAEPPSIKKLVRHESTIGELEDARAAREQADQQAKKNAG